MVKADPYVQDTKYCDGLVKLTYQCSFLPSWTLFTGMTLVVQDTKVILRQRKQSESVAHEPRLPTQTRVVNFTTKRKSGAALYVKKPSNGLTLTHTHTDDNI